MPREKGTRGWSHKSVLRLIKESGLPGEQPEETIARKARELVAQGKRLGWTGPPFDVRLLATILGIRTKESSAILAEAQIIPLGGQFELIFRTDVAPTRLSFTFAHEIGHTLFPDCGAMIHERNFSRDKFDPERQVEKLCDIAAAQILMPAPYFENDLRKLGGGLRAVDGLAIKYNASREAIARRIPSGLESHCALVYFRYGYNREESDILTGAPDEIHEEIKPKLRIVSVYPSTGYPLFLPRGKSVPDNSILYDLLTGKNFVSATEFWTVKNFDKRLVEGIRLYHEESSDRLGFVALIH